MKRPKKMRSLYMRDDSSIADPESEHFIYLAAYTNNVFGNKRVLENSHLCKMKHNGITCISCSLEDMHPVAVVKQTGYTAPLRSVLERCSGL